MLDCSLPVIMGKEQSEHSQTLLVVLCQIPAAPAWAAVIVNLLVPGEPCPFSTSLQYLQMCWKSSWHKQSRLLSALAEVCVFGFSLFSVVVSSPYNREMVTQGRKSEIRRCLTFPYTRKQGCKLVRIRSSSSQLAQRRSLAFPADREAGGR